MEIVVEVVFLNKVSPSYLICSSCTTTPAHTCSSNHTYAIMNAYLEVTVMFLTCLHKLPMAGSHTDEKPAGEVLQSSGVMSICFTFDNS